VVGTAEFIGLRGLVRMLGSFALILLAYPIVTLLMPSSGIIPPSIESVRVYPEGEKYNWDGVISTGPAAPEALKLLDSFAGAVGTSHDVRILAGAFSKKYGALAGVHNGMPTIIYDQAEFLSGGGRISYDFAGVLAHEYGHLIQSHFLRARAPATEREADRTAGFILGRLGLSLKNSQIWTNRLSERGSDTHPPRAARREAAQAGWKAAKNQKRWEVASSCESDWSSAPIIVGGEHCRLVRTCEADGPASRLACQSYTGDWVWKDAR
jgi:hypothetical protein